MKRIYMTLLFLAFALLAKAQGVVFEELSFDQALAKAKQENKLVFLNLSGTHCGPCHKMLKEVFPLQEVGDYFNSRFVCVKYMTDAEADGKALSKRFKPGVVPAYFILDANGEEIHRKTSYMESEKLIAWAERATGKKTNARYLKGLAVTGKKMSRLDELRYYLALRDSREEQTEVGKKVWAKLEKSITDKELLQSEYWELIADDNYRTPTFDFVIRHASELLAGPHAKWVNRYLLTNFTDTIVQILRVKDEQSGVKMTGLCERIAAIDFPDKAWLQPRAEMVKGYFTGDYQLLVDNLSTIAKEKELFRPDDLASRAFSLISKISDVEIKGKIAPLFNEIASRHENNGRPATASLIRLYIKQMLHGRALAYEYQATFDQALRWAKEKKCNLFVEIMAFNPMLPGIYAAVAQSDSVGRVVNPRHVVLKLDANTSEGQQFMQRYNVPFIPCYSIISGEDGALVHQFASFETISEFLTEVEKASDPDQAFGNLQRLKMANQLTRQQSINYILGLENLGQLDLCVKEADQLFATLNDTERLSPEYWPVTSRLSVGSEGMKYILPRLEQLIGQVGETCVNDFMKKMYMRFNFNLYALKDAPGRANQLSYKTVDEVRAASKQLYKDLKMDITPNGKREVFALDLLNAYLDEDFDRVVKAIAKIANNFDFQLHSCLFPLLASWIKDQCTTIERVSKIADLYPKFKEAMQSQSPGNRGSLAVFSPYLSAMKKAKEEKK